MLNYKKIFALWLEFTHLYLEGKVKFGIFLNFQFMGPGVLGPCGPIVIPTGCSRPVPDLAASQQEEEQTVLGHRPMSKVKRLHVLWVRIKA